MEDINNDVKRKRSKDRSPSPAIKSTAVVKYTSVQSPVGYSRLQCNTDLNRPPSNWSSALDSYGLKQILSRSSGLSSFRMAHMFPDSVGEVDVISGAECIKKLLKLPYQPNGTVSMVVHRVENTLLLDDFDVYDYLMKSEWSWLRDFFYENVLKTMTEQEQMITEKKPSIALQLTSKFLCHSVTSQPVPERTTEFQPPMCLYGPFLPEPEMRTQTPPNDHLYNRNVLWTFENIQMLIGSDLPIFGGIDRPCVSLRLRDAQEPINVLTGIDYWLDNLMCNVPEVLMCYHLDGIVQKYEPMKTEDLPNIDGSKFSPKVIRNVAQNILSFLKSNATKAGHTYWLFKGPLDDVVKLYDLTSLCGGLENSMENPFTTPVAMLLYRVARNMRMMNRTKHVKELLENAIKLLSDQTYPQIVASSYYMLADLYVPADTNPACPDFKESSDASDQEDDDVNDESELSDKAPPPAEDCRDSRSLAVQMRGLALTDIGKSIRPSYEQQKSKKTQNELGVEPPDRCGNALKHALKGLNALHHVNVQKSQDEDRPKMANPFEPIKLHYQPLKKHNDKENTSKLPKDSPKDHGPKEPRGRRRKRDKRTHKNPENYLIESKPGVDKNAILVRTENVFPTFREPSRNDNYAWKLHLKTLLYEKICLSYATLAEYSYSNEQYGFSLKYIHLASKCQKLLNNMIIKSRVVDSSCLLGRIGDNYFQLSKRKGGMDSFRRQLEFNHETDRLINIEIDRDMSDELERDCNSGDFDLNIDLPEREVESMLLSCEYYEKALQVAANDKRNELLRRLASVKNELGVKYMNDAQLTYVKFVESNEQETECMDRFKDLSAKSLDCLNEAADIFERVNDTPNLALLFCNKGRYMRFKAHCDLERFTAEKRRLYVEAEELYVRALRLLGSRDSCGALSVWELVAWELSSHTYTRAALMQDHPDRYHNDASDVAEALKHALKHCVLREGPRHYLYQFRAAMIHHRLASLYHNQYREVPVEGNKRRTLASLSRSSYERASNMFAALEDAAMCLTVNLEHVALLEGLAHNTPNLKLKSLQTALQLLRQSHSIVELIKNRDPDDVKLTPAFDEIDEKTMRNEHNLLSLFESRLHFILKSIIQYFRSKSNKDYDKMTDVFKKLYSVSLKIKKCDDVRLYASSVCDVLGDMEAVSCENV